MNLQRVVVLLHTVACWVLLVHGPLNSSTSVVHTVCPIKSVPFFNWYCLNRDKIYRTQQRSPDDTYSSLGKISRFVSFAGITSHIVIWQDFSSFSLEILFYCKAVQLRSTVNCFSKNVWFITWFHEFQITEKFRKKSVVLSVLHIVIFSSRILESMVQAMVSRISNLKKGIHFVIFAGITSHVVIWQDFSSFSSHEWL